MAPRAPKKPKAKKSKKSPTPTNPKLYARVKAEAKKKFDVYPSAYANAWLVRTYKKRGGGYRSLALKNGLEKAQKVIGLILALLKRAASSSHVAVNPLRNQSGSTLNACHDLKRVT